MKHSVIHGEVSSKWCILRTSPGRTLALARSLSGAGIEAWTPQQTLTRRRPRSHITFEIEVPIAPTFVFAREHSVAALLRIQSSPRQVHPAFSVFQHCGRIPLVSDKSIDGLREEELAMQEQVRLRLEAAERARLLGDRLSKRRVVPSGTKVAIASGCFAGMTGVVEGGNRKEACVNLGGNWLIKIETWRFAEDIVCTDQAHMSNAAIAA
jgi:hypothetical protein